VLQVTTGIAQMAYQPQVPTDTLSSAARGYKQFAKLSELDGLGQIQHESAQAETTTQSLRNHREPRSACLAAHSSQPGVGSERFGQLVRGFMLRKAGLIGV
jgi:hypothetical protein